MRRRIYLFLARWLRKAVQALQPPPDHERENRFLKQALSQLVSESLEQQQKADAMSRIAELVEARRMAGAGPWRTSAAVLEDTDRLIGLATESLNASPAKLRETLPSAQGATGDIELALQNVEWRREVNLSWLEFSRWGIQQIILISRLYYLKNPLIQRGINVASIYVFGRGVEVSSPDETANEVLKEFFERNAKTLGQIALVNLEKQKYYDGNLFFAFFPDTTDTGQVTVRTIDATEIQEIITDPNDTDTPWFYKRQWSERVTQLPSGNTSLNSKTAWYPALGHIDATDRPPTIGTYPVMWDTPVHHRKCGAVAKWNFGCPLVYAALDWARAAREFLEHCATVKKALAQFAMMITTKGGQQAMEGMKAQLGTTVGPTSNLWDANPPTTMGGIFASGPGTKLEAFNSKGAGGDPGEVKEYRNMVAAVFGIPPTFFGDMDTSNLATATSLDRPTELNFLEKQEAWREDLSIIARYVLRISNGATSGKLREAAKGSKLIIREAKRVWKGGNCGRWVMEAKKVAGVVEVSVNFPAIREGDLKDLVSATVEALTLNNRQGGIVGIDEKAGIRKLYDIIGIEDGDELTEKQFPDGEYDPDRTKEPPAEPVPHLGTEPGAPIKPTEAVKLARRLVQAVAEEKNGSQHIHSR